jgi:hypothetical protein
VNFGRGELSREGADSVLPGSLLGDRRLLLRLLGSERGLGDLEDGDLVSVKLELPAELTLLPAILKPG